MSYYLQIFSIHLIHIVHLCDTLHTQLLLTHFLSQFEHIGDPGRRLFLSEQKHISKEV
jgi:hypothetical protein